MSSARRIFNASRADGARDAELRRDLLFRGRQPVGELSARNTAGEAPRRPGWAACEA